MTGREAKNTKGETMNTEQRLFAVRCTSDWCEGTSNHEYYHGQDPTVFRSKTDATQHCERLNAESLDLDWGRHEPPTYEVEEITQDQMWDAEEIAE